MRIVDDHAIQAAEIFQSAFVRPKMQFEMVARQFAVAPQADESILCTAANECSRIVKMKDAATFWPGSNGKLNPHREAKVTTVPDSSITRCQWLVVRGASPDLQCVPFPLPAVGGEGMSAQFASTVPVMHPVNLGASCTPRPPSLTSSVNLLEPCRVSPIRPLACAQT